MAERGIKNHPTQVALLLKALELVKEGGRVVYSTCSLNPIENEAVVAAALQWGGEVEREWVKMVDVSSQLRALKRQPGLSQWKVPDRQDASVVYKSFQEVRPSRKDLERERNASAEMRARVGGNSRLEEVRRGLTASMFPPQGLPASTEEEEDPLHLRRAVRILPHLQNTGGFFVAVLEKTGPMPFDFPSHLDGGASKSESQEQRKRMRKSVESWRKIGGGGGRKDADEAGFVPLTTTPHGAGIAEELGGFFGLGPSFPVEQLLAASLNVSQIRFVTRDACRFMLNGAILPSSPPCVRVCLSVCLSVCLPPSLPSSSLVSLRWN